MQNYYDGHEDLWVMKKNKEIIHTLLLVLAALIWGCAFTAQTIGAEYVGPYTFLAIRTWIGFAALLPLLLIRYKFTVRDRRERNIICDNRTVFGEKKDIIVSGFLCGLFIFAASAAQQIGIMYTTTAKAGFITTMYVVIVPILYVFTGKKIARKIWGCVFLSVIGLYLLCMSESLKLGFGDGIVLLCAFLFSLQIICVNKYVDRVDAVLLTCMQFLVEAIFATICMLIFETVSVEGLLAAMPSILYAGFLSSGVGYTLQSVAQKGLNPTIASIAMSLESVFSALCGFIVLGQALKPRELMGCIIMFAAIIISQLPGKQDISDQILNEED